jgi:hypothetical protein
VLHSGLGVNGLVLAVVELVNVKEAGFEGCRESGGRRLS